MKINDTTKVNNSSLLGNSIMTPKKEKDEKNLSGDKLVVSASSKKLILEAREKACILKDNVHFSSISGEIREIPAEYKCENLFKMELRSDSLSGGVSFFQANSEKQYKVFEEWLNNNANGLSDDERQNIANQIKMATSELDKLNSQEGYRGTSFESVFLTETSRVALESINETMVPEYLKKGFQGLIDEYVHFNESARDSIMERMTPDYMVIDIEKDTETYKYKEEILSGERNFYVQEKAEVMDKFAQFTSGKLSKEDFFEDIRKYVGLYYESQYSTTGNIATINNNTNFLLNAVKQIIY